MPYLQPPKGKSPNDAKAQRAALALRIDRAARDLNPFLMVFAAGLVLLNLTFCLGMAVARQPVEWSPPLRNGAVAAPAAVSPAVFTEGAPATRPGH
jgi:hypothetical protein